LSDSKTITIDARVAWGLAATIAAAALSAAVAIWHERDSRIERDVEQIQAERKQTLDRYLESKDRQDELLEALTRRLEADQ
jgi:hypothetical protein